MAKKRQSSQSVRQSAKRREEEQRQRRKQQLMWVGIAAVILVALAAVAVVVLSSEPDEQTAATDLDETSEERASSEPVESPEQSTPVEPEDPGATTSLDEFDDAGPLADLEPIERFAYYDQAPEMVIDPEKAYEALILTEKGDIRLRLFAEESPLTVNNFVYLAREGFYDGTIFHRVIQDFMAQGGDPTGTGAGGPGYQFADEVDTGLVFDRPGLLAMANSGPNTNGSQFFITYVPTPHLNGLHTIFGEIVEGDEVLDSLTFVQPGSAPTPQGDVIERIVIIES
jgi:cyclophilin family peptidyl-prolyl cis-trans isomerase